MPLEDRPTMGLFFLLLILLAGLGALLLSLPRGIVRTIVKIGALFFLGMLIVLFLYALGRDGPFHGPEWVFLFLLLCGLTFLLLWGLMRLFASAPPDQPPADARRLGLLKHRLKNGIERLEQTGRRASVWPGLVIAFVVGFFALLLLSESAFKPGHPFTTMMFFLVFVLTLTVFITGILRLFVLPASNHAHSVCPPIDRLKAFLRERLPRAEHARLAAHLDGCPTCQHRLEGLTAGHEAWSVVARKLTDRPPPPEPALKQVMESLRGKKEEETSDEPVFSADLPLGFLSPADKPGQLGRLERYEVVSEIGRGGMGVVLKAFDPSLHRVVAIKVLAPQLATSGVARKRFLREAKAAAAVTHEHIVTIHSVEETNGLPYLVMQYVPGQSLQERLDKDGPISELSEILRIGIQTASALAAAHSHGIVHRDIKPGNILLEDGVQRVKITDFGLARAMDDASMTQSGYVAGSPLYMAPEQARGETLDHRADLFSLGSVLYTVCTGRPPFRAANTLAVLRRVCEDVPRPIRESNAEIPKWLTEIIEKLMAKEPEERFQSAAEVVEVLAQHLAPLQHAGWEPPPQPATPRAAPAPPVAGLPTSLTLCPACGASLHVPERMVGGLVHCGECGKPFRVEDTSEVMQVARPVPPPFARRPRGKGRPQAWFIILFLCVLGLFLFICTVRLATDTASVPQVAPAGTPVLTSTGETRQAGDPYWKSALKGLPAEASLFGAVDLKAFGSLNLGDEWTQTAVRVFSSAKAADKVMPENLGRVRIDGISMAYYEDLKGAKSRALIQLEGLAIDGRKRIVDFLREASAEKLTIEEDKQLWQPGKPVRIHGPGLPFAVGLMDDHRAFLARSIGQGAGGPTSHLEVLELLPWLDQPDKSRPWSDLDTGYKPPWLQMALGELPPKICGMCLGEIPLAWRKSMTETLALRSCPRTFVFHMKREGDAVALTLSLNLEKPGGEVTLTQQLDRWYHQQLAELEFTFPATRSEPKALALIRKSLKVRWQANARSASVRASMRVPGPTWKVLGTLVKRLAASRDDPKVP
jgi:serine/threonine-protein kinase